MGMNTTVLIMNDFIHRIKTDENFQERLAYMIGAGQTGEVVQGVKIIESHHADDVAYVRIGYNSGSRVWTPLNYIAIVKCPCKRADVIFNGVSHSVCSKCQQKFEINLSFEKTK